MVSPDGEHSEKPRPKWVRRNAESVSVGFLLPTHFCSCAKPFFFCSRLCVFWPMSKHKAPCRRKTPWTRPATPSPGEELFIPIPLEKLSRFPFLIPARSRRVSFNLQNGLSYRLPKPLTKSTRRDSHRTRHLTKLRSKRTSPISRNTRF